MPDLVWDRAGDRAYESGLDRGVLYLPNGTGVAWNGLVSVIEKFNKTVSPIYFDGMKISDLVSLGDFAATMKAVTYPDEFVDVEGSASLRNGVSFSDQVPQTFGLCYRTKISDDLNGDTGYKLHILYNVTAIPHDKTYASVSNDPSLIEFEWDIVAVPEETPGYRPTAHLIINSNEVDPLLLTELESMLYGSTSADAALLPMADLVTFMSTWYRIKIVDNGDGTWSAIIREELSDILLSWQDDPTDTMFTLAGANALFSSDETQYTLSDTMDVKDIAEIKVYFYDDGSWSATSDSDILIPPPTSDGEFQITNANAIFLDPDTYRISDTGFGE